MTSLEHLYQVIEMRRAEPEENSYTCYLLDQGLDKILKKVGEESAETIIAAKNGDPQLLCEEISDLLYHLMVLLVSQDISLDQVDDVLQKRSEKIGNLKQQHQVDHAT